jgi:NAD(P)-dependent dehydrogenase (short-subunit alcohol dehydrogenase family)
MAAQPDTVLVTGASRGLGLEFARQYAAAGWHVFAACRGPNDAKDLQLVAAENNGRVRILQMDVTDDASVRTAATELKEEAIDLLINNAGVGGPGQRLGRATRQRAGPACRAHRRMECPAARASVTSPSPRSL